MHANELQQPTRRMLAGLAADDYGQEDQRTPLVLLHGMTFDRTIWRTTVDELQRADPGRRVLALDLPGHGESPELASYHLAHIPDRLHRAIEEAGLVAPILVGHSAGALGATVYAARHPVSGFVNVDQPLLVGPFAELVTSLADRLRGPDFPAIWQMFYDSFHTELLPAPARELVRATCRPRQQVVLGYWRQILEGRTDELIGLVQPAMDAMRAAGVPYVHIAGDEPGPHYRSWLGEQLPAATLEVWPGSGHFPHLAHPASFTRLLAATSHWTAVQKPIA